MQCQDFDECLETTDNDCDQICQNTQGSYICTCFDGFTRYLIEDRYYCLGIWSNWSEWTECDQAAPCSTQVRTRQRQCQSGVCQPFLTYNSKTTYFCDQYNETTNICTSFSSCESPGQTCSLKTRPELLVKKYKIAFNVPGLEDGPEEIENFKQALIAKVLLETKGKGFAENIKIIFP